MEEGIHQEAEETVITNFLQLSLNEAPQERSEDEDTINCNHIRIGTFITDTVEPQALCVDTGAPRSVVGKM